MIQSASMDSMLIHPNPFGASRPAMPRRFKGGGGIQVQLAARKRKNTETKGITQHRVFWSRPKLPSCGAVAKTAVMGVPKCRANTYTCLGTKSQPETNGCSWLFQHGLRSFTKWLGLGKHPFLSGWDWKNPGGCCFPKVISPSQRPWLFACSG